jgi:hypothetical protein
VTKLNEDAVKALPVPDTGNRVHYFPDAVIQGAKAPRGFGVRVTSGGVRSFVMNYRVKLRERRYTIGQWPDWSVLTAVKEARTLRQRIDRGEDPLDDRPKAEPTATTLKAVIEGYFTLACGMTRDADGKPTFNGKLRSAEQRLKVFERLVYPEEISRRQVGEIRRSDITALLEKIEVKRGARMAHVMLAYLTKLFNWYAARTDDFRSPIVRGMSPIKAKERASTHASWPTGKFVTCGRCSTRPNERR